MFLIHNMVCLKVKNIAWNYFVNVVFFIVLMNSEGCLSLHDLFLGDGRQTHWRDGKARQSGEEAPGAKEHCWRKGW